MFNYKYLMIGYYILKHISIYISHPIICLILRGKIKMETKKMEKITFKDLSGWLKVAVVMSLVIGGFYIAIFIFGFIRALIGGL